MTAAPATDSTNTTTSSSIGEKKGGDEDEDEDEYKGTKECPVIVVPGVSCTTRYNRVILFLLY
jgi:hypothetical protein